MYILNWRCPSHFPVAGRVVSCCPLSTLICHPTSGHTGYPMGGHCMYPMGGYWTYRTLSLTWMDGYPGYVQDIVCTQWMYSGHSGFVRMNGCTQWVKTQDTLNIACTLHSCLCNGCQVTQGIFCTQWMDVPMILSVPNGWLSSGYRLYPMDGCTKDIICTWWLDALRIVCTQYVFCPWYSVCTQWLDVLRILSVPNGCMNPGYFLCTQCNRWFYQGYTGYSVHPLDEYLEQYCIYWMFSICVQVSFY